MTRLFGLGPQLSVVSGSLPNTILKELGWLGGDKLTELSLEDSSRNFNSSYTDLTLDFVCRACPNLLRLSVQESCSTLTDASVRSIVTHCTKLESLTINWKNITDVAMDDLSSISTLKQLALSCCGSVAPPAIVKVLAANQGLESVDIYIDIYINDSILQCIRDHLPNLRELSLEIDEEGDQISGDSMFIAITKSCPLLEKFDIIGWDFSDDLLLSLSLHCPCLRHLEVAWRHEEEDWVEEEAQEQEQQSMVTEATLLQFFQACPELHTLEYLPRTATDASLRALVVHCHQLEMIGLRDNILVTDSGLCDMFKGCHNIRIIRIFDCPNITDESLFTLARYCPEVRTIALECPKVTEASLLYIATHCCKLQELILRHMSVSDDILSILARRCKNLKLIYLISCTAVTTAGVLCLINKCRRLTKLLVCECNVHITPELLMYMRGGCEVNKERELFVSVTNKQ